MANSKPDIYRPALISGLIFGFLGGAPIVDLLNCFCCSLILASGFTAAFLYSRNHQAAGIGFDAMAGIKVGLLSGLVYAIVATIASSVTGLLWHEATTKWLIEILDEIPDVPPQVTDQLARGMERGFVPWMLWELFYNLGLGIIFATIGGLIGGAVFKSESAVPPPAPTVPPTTT